MRADSISVESASLRSNAPLEPPKRSEHGLLTEAFGIAVDAASGKTGSQKQSESSKSSWGVAEFASGFVKAVPLFMGPGRGTALSAVLHGLDEVHSGDNRTTQLTDFALGSVKGAANKLVMDKFGASEISMAGKGIAIGGGSTFIDSSLTRTNWIDQKTGAVDFNGGLQKTAFQTAFGSMVGMAAFPLGHALGGKITPSVQRMVGTSLDSNVVAAVTTGGSFGFTSGVVGETASQIYSGSFDPLAIAKRGLLEGLSTSAAGGVGHRFSAQYALSHAPSDKPAKIGLTLAGGDRVGPEGTRHSVSPSAELTPESATNLGSPRKEVAKETATAEAEIAPPGNEIFPPREMLNAVPVPGRYGENGLWHAKQTLEGYSEAQIKEATAHLPEHYTLGKPETMADFRERLTPVLDGWQKNNAEVLQKVEAAEASLTLAGQRRGDYLYISDKVIHQVRDKLPEFLVKELQDSATKLRDFLLSPSATMLGVTKTSERAEKVNALVEARTQYSEDYRQTTELLEPRIQQIQKIADQFTSAHGLSRVEIASEDGPGPLGSYLNGRIKLQREYFTGRDNTGLAGTLYHELLHHEQYTLMVRRLADRAGIGKEPDQSDREYLVESYRIWLNKSLPETYLNQILDARNGERLTEQQSAVADTLLDTTERHTKKDSDAYKDSGNAFRKINSLLNKLNGEKGEKVALGLERDAASESDLLISLNPQFTAVLPPKVSADALSPGQTRSNIIDGLREWQIDINLWRMYDYTEYRGRKLEWDAWLLTSLMHNAMDAKSN